MAAAALSAALLFALVACAPEEPAEPTPTPTSAFATEDEAFAAAEETYRAYVDALNARHADPAAKPDPTDYLIEDALEAELDTQRLLEEEGRAIVGTATVARFAGARASGNLAEIAAIVCLDVSESRLVDDNGIDVTPTDRPEVFALDVAFVRVGDQLAISDSSVASDQTC